MARSFADEAECPDCECQCSYEGECQCDGQHGCAGCELGCDGATN